MSLLEFLTVSPPTASKRKPVKGYGDDDDDCKPKRKSSRGRKAATKKSESIPTRKSPRISKAANTKQKKAIYLPTMESFKKFKSTKPVPGNDVVMH